MKRSVCKLVSCATIAIFLSATDANSGQFSLFGNALLRYENETKHINIPDSERLGVLAHFGAKYRLNKDLQLADKLRTEVKKKQNAPAVTVHQFNEQPAPDNDGFLEHFYIKGKLNKADVSAGKLPWQSWQVTDMFWDRQLASYGVDMSFQKDHVHALYAMYAKPLDGSKDTVGDLFVGQWQYRYEHNNVRFTIAPWFVSYKGQENALHAKNDTQQDNLFARLSVEARYGVVSIGADMGQSLSSFDKSDFQEFADQKRSFALQVGYGNLENPGDYQAHLRYLHVGRFGVISGFTQNAVTHSATSNIRGWDITVQRKMNNSVWLGSRLSSIEEIIGEEKGVRLRVEAQYKF